MHNNENEYGIVSPDKRISLTDEIEDSILLEESLKRLENNSHNSLIPAEDVYNMLGISPVQK